MCKSNITTALPWLAGLVIAGAGNATASGPPQVSDPIAHGNNGHSVPGAPDVPGPALTDDLWLATLSSPGVTGKRPMVEIPFATPPESWDGWPSASEMWRPLPASAPVIGVPHGGAVPGPGVVALLALGAG